MRPYYISQMSQSPILSKLNFPSAEGEAEGEAEVTKEEGAIKVTLTSVEAIDNNIRIKISKVKDNNKKINIRIFSLKEVEGEDQMRNQAYNAITAKSMGNMNLNAGRSKQISSQAEHHTKDTSRGMFLSCHKTEQQPKDLWLLDSGCNNHMTGNK